ncbi:hypothetical protein BaRGS_00008423 [Batillaria attramentaria]|uniref:Uncharacterized protein n=1 Tax=Batillaria attramentaria TaxID=370345 RepID=A0ABD0LL55_9CAEN
MTAGTQFWHVTATRAALIGGADEARANTREKSGPVIPEHGAPIKSWKIDSDWSEGEKCQCGKVKLIAIGCPPTGRRTLGKVKTDCDWMVRAKCQKTCAFKKKNLKKKRHALMQ